MIAVTVTTGILFFCDTVQIQQHRRCDCE